MEINEFDTFDFLINEEDEVMLLLYARDGEPNNPSVEVDKEEGLVILYRNDDDHLELRDVAADVFDSLQDADKLMVCELSKDSADEEAQIIRAYEADIEY
jgi:hypothetical protein